MTSIDLHNEAILAMQRWGEGATLALRLPRLAGQSLRTQARLLGRDGGPLGFVVVELRDAIIVRFDAERLAEWALNATPAQDRAVAVRGIQAVP
jgi:hypothetical protein